MLFLPGFLKSYEHMGVARVSCVKGCLCKAQEIDTEDRNDTNSQTSLWHFQVDQVSPLQSTGSTAGSLSQRVKAHGQAQGR
jgi:hypothetical protein